MRSRREWQQKFAADSLREAKLGNMNLLAMRLRNGDALSEGEREFLAEFLYAHDGWRGRAFLRQHEWARMRRNFEELREEGVPKEKAITAVAEKHNTSRSTVREAIKREALIRDDPSDLQKK
jgi:hypothetical protein